MTTDPISLYVHWPWCQSKCPYCDFNSHTNKTELVNTYTQALLQDLENQYKMVGSRPISTVFFGGGTPSLMPPETVELIINQIDKTFGLSKGIEITLEANPSSTDAGKLSSFKLAGVNRLSIGVQSFHDKHLKFLGRLHTSKEAAKTVTSAVNIFNNVNFDLIYGLPNQNLTEWGQDIDLAVSLGSKHISAYQLTVEPNTKFFSEVKRGKWQPSNNDVQADFFEETQKQLSKLNFNNYEISNFCKSGHECLHNLNIWQYKDYIGIGAGAHGRVSLQGKPKNITQSYKQIQPYIDSVKHCETFFYQSHPLTPQEAFEEKALMGLRLQKGTELHNWRSSTYASNIQTLEKQGLLHTTKDNIQLTPQGWPLLDAVLGKILSL